jgi:hypothetical protein
MPEPLHVCALVPAKNEAATIADTVRGLLSIPAVTQVLVIDDGSTDDTAERALSAGATVLRFAVNQGQAQAIMAGARAIEDADVFLIVDGDVGASAVLAEQLLTPVLEDRADMTIANLPPAATGGFGTVKRTAQWGVRKGAGIELKAPISGQRAMRADLLRSMKPSGHFGFSVSLSIDASRAGARIVEVDVPLTHRHTGKTLGGFVHRGKQGFFLLRALWPRLTSSRFRVGAAFLGFAVLAAALLFSGAQHAKVAGVVQPQARKVVIFGLPGLTWDELREDTPNLRALADRGAIGDLMVKTGSTGPSTYEGYAALGAGSPVRATLPTALALPADAPFESDTAATALSRRTGTHPSGEIVDMGVVDLRILNAGKHLNSDPGTLGDTLQKAHLRTAIVGNADVSPSEDLSLQPARRPTAPALMTSGGSVDTGTVAPDALLVDDPAFAYGRRADPRKVLQAVDRALARSDVVVVDPGDLDRVDEQRRSFLSVAAVESRARALRATDSILGQVEKRLGPDTLLIVTGVRPPRGEWRLSPVVVRGPGVPHGYVNSPGTHRRGVATLYDLAPTILYSLGVDVPVELSGKPVRYEETTPSIDRLDRLDRDASFRSEIFNATTTAFVVAQLIAYALIALLLYRHATNRWFRQLRWLALAILAFPPATYLYRAIPNVAALGTGGLALLVGIIVVLVALSQRTGKHPLGPAVFLMALTIVILVIDVATGNSLQLSSILGLSLNSAGRYYGYGNSSLALLAAGAIMLATIAVELSASKRDMALAASAFLVFIMLVDGAPVLGNDIGGIITLAPVFTVVIALMIGWRITWRTVVVGLVVALAALGLAAAADLVRSSDSQSHFGKLIDSVRADGWSPLSDTVQRKIGAVFRLVQNSVWTRLVPIGGAYLWFTLLWRGRWQKVLGGQPTLRLGIVAALAAGLLGSVVNDSGPIVLALVISIVCPVVTLLVLQSERDTAPVLMEATAPTPPSSVRGEPDPARA